MSETGRKALVYVQGEYCGSIEETEDEYVFSYDPAYVNTPGALAVSLTLPLREEPYHSHRLFPFFDGLIPEGWLLSVVCRNWKINEKDRFGMLMAVCRDCIGDVSVKGEST